MLSKKSKYYPLYEHLRQQPQEGLYEMSFAQIEELLNKPLPASAYAIRAWWSNSKTSQGQAWVEAKWVVDDVDFEAKYVVFRPAHISHRLTPIRKSQGWTAKQIKALRKHAGWSQQQLANKLGVRQQTVSDWELGIHTSRRSMGKLLQLIAEQVGFEYDPDEEESDEAEEEPSPENEA